MTTDAGLPAVRESLYLALLASPEGGPLVVDLAEAAVEPYALDYSKHPRTCCSRRSAPSADSSPRP